MAASALVLAAALAAACRAPAPPPAVGSPEWSSVLPATHELLSAVLAGLPPGEFGTRWTPSADAALRRYLATVAAAGPVSHPELFPSRDDVLAYLVNAHIAGALALAHSSRLVRADVARLRTESFTVDGAPASLATLTDEIARLAPWEPRLALFLNPGWRGGPPLPPSALEGRALDWQLALHGERCGRSSGFWTLAADAHRISLPAYADGIWGLPAEQPARTRRLLELVPPPPPLRAAITSACGASLQRCTVVAAPFDTTRAVAAADSAR